MARQFRFDHSRMHSGRTHAASAVPPVTLLGDPKKVFEASYAKMRQAIRALVTRAVNSGDIRKDLDPVDLLHALVGVANVAASPDWKQSAKRLVDILIAGSRPVK